MIEPLTPEQAELVAQEYELVYKVISRLKRTRRTLKDDLISAGTLGLIDAAKRFDKSKGYKFATYAQYRIHGAIRDWMREEQPLGRKHLIKIKEGKSPEIKFYSIETFSKSSDNPTIEFIPSREPRPEEKLETEDFWRKLIEILPERDALILVLYYREFKRFKDIGQLLRVTESAVCARHKRILESLREICMYDPSVREIILKTIGEGKTRRKDICESVLAIHPGSKPGQQVASMVRDGILEKVARAQYQIVDKSAGVKVTGTLHIDMGDNVSVDLIFSKPTKFNEISKLLEKFNAAP